MQKGWGETDRNTNSARPRCHPNQGTKVQSLKFSNLEVQASSHCSLESESLSGLSGSEMK